MMETISLLARLLAYLLPQLLAQLRRELSATITARRARWFGFTPAASRDRNIVVVGASFAGYYAARSLALGLPPRTRYRVVVIEPNSHFQFSWVLPRYCVVGGHEHKAFIPYGGLVRAAPEGAVRWVRDRVGRASAKSVFLQDSGEEIPVNETEKLSGMQRLKAMQGRLKAANTVVVVGGGAAGVELATDAKDLYPDKKIILVHSRSAPMHRFGKALQDAAMKALKEMDADAILSERVAHEDSEAGTITLQSGRVLECDLVINCTGQKPSSHAFSSLSPLAICPSGHIRTKPTLQIADDVLPNVYVCGDVAEPKAANANAFLARRQAFIATDNILLAVRGQAPRHTYEPNWADGSIKLTLGLHRSVFHIGDGQSALQFSSKDKDEALMAVDAWSHLGEKPFRDPSTESLAKETELALEGNM